MLTCSFLGLMPHDDGGGSSPARSWPVLPRSGGSGTSPRIAIVPMTVSFPTTAGFETRRVRQEKRHRELLLCGGEWLASAVPVLRKLDGAEAGQSFSWPQVRERYCMPRLCSSRSVASAR